MVLASYQQTIRAYPNGVGVGLLAYGLCRAGLLFRRNTVVVDVPYHLDEARRD